jgi:hypothetical protein
MTIRIAHAGHEIVVVDEDQTIANQCSPGDTAITKREGGYVVSFVGEDGEVNSWEDVFDAVEEAIHAIKSI